MGPPGVMRLQFPLLCRVRDPLKTTQQHSSPERTRWRRTLRQGAFALPIAVASLGLLAGVGAASFTTGAAHIYVVRPGDSLWAISQANGLSVYQLAAANHISPADMEAEFFRSGRPSSLLKRFTEPAEIANMVAYVCSTAASATNGAALRAEGGIVRSLF